MTKFAPARTAFCSTSSVAIDVVTTPVTIVDGSPALNVSTSSLPQSTPMFFFTRSTISCAVTVAPCTNALPRMNGVATAPAAVSATKSRLEMFVMSPQIVPHRHLSGGEILRAPASVLVA